MRHNRAAATQKLEKRERWKERKRKGRKQFFFMAFFLRRQPPLLVMTHAQGTIALYRDDFHLIVSIRLEAECKHANSVR